MSSTRGSIRKKASRTPAASSAPTEARAQRGSRQSPAANASLAALAASDDEAAAAFAVPDPVPMSVQQLLTLYSEQLEGVGFPDVSVAILSQAAADLRARAEALEAARSRLGESEVAVQSALGQLQRLAERALAYARIYASGNQELQERLAKIRLEPDRPLLRKPRKTRAPLAASSAAPESALPPPNGSAASEAGAST